MTKKNNIKTLPMEEVVESNITLLEVKRREDKYISSIVYVKAPSKIDEPTYNTEEERYY